MATVVTHSWIPSTARVVVLEGFGQIPRGVPPVVAGNVSWPAKDPLDVLDYVVDLSDAIAGNEGDAVATLDVQIAPSAAGDLTLVSARADGDQVVVWLAGGFGGTTYGVTLTIGTNAGRVISRTIDLPVQALARPPVPPGALIDQAGNPLIDQGGSILTTS